MRRLIDCALFNLRDLGGYFTKSGRITKYGCFFRSEVPSELSESDCQKLNQYGIHVAMDLRGSIEKEKIKSSLEGSIIKVINCPLYDSNEVEALKNKFLSVAEPTTWGEIYIRTIEVYKDWVVKAILVAALCKDGLLFHCTSGKDRTGVISALLLSLVEVPREDILVDYACSECFLKKSYEKQYGIQLNGYQYKDPFFKTPLDSMNMLLDFIESKYGNTENYLKSIGITEVYINALKDKFLQ